MKLLIFICYIIPQCLQSKLTDELVTYEEKVLQAFINPSTPKGFTLTENLDWYNKQFVHVLESIRNTDNDTYMKVDADLDYFVKSMWKKGGPDFLSIKLNNSVLMKKLNWSENTMQEMYYSYGATQVLWDELKELNPHGEHYFQSFNKSDYDYLYNIDKNGKLNQLADFTKPDDFF